MAKTMPTILRLELDEVAVVLLEALARANTVEDMLGGQRSKRPSLKKRQESSLSLVGTRVCGSSPFPGGLAPGRGNGLGRRNDSEVMAG